MLLDRIEPASETADILIVGAGAVGLTMGIALARAGKRVLLCEAGQARLDPEWQAHNHVVRIGIAPQRDNPELLDRLARLIGPMDRVVVSCPPERQHAWAMILKGGHMRGEIISSSVDSLGIIGTARVGALGTLVVASGPLGLRARMLKRALDLAISIPALGAAARRGQLCLDDHSQCQ